MPTKKKTEAGAPANDILEQGASLPEWVEETPDEDICYELTMYEKGSDVQLIELNRDEFIALKEHLAALRGYGLGDELKRIKDDDPDVAKAREIYCAFPALVMAHRL